MFDVDALVRENIRQLRPYTSARDEYQGGADVYLDANENAFGSPFHAPLNRYPDPLQRALKENAAAAKGVRPEQIFVGNGSDEAIDLLLRIFCEPHRDEAIICPPTYGMYNVAADLNAVRVREVPLTPRFQLDVSGIVAAAAESVKIVFMCSPNNPTGNVMDRGDVLRVIESTAKIVVVDEAYIDFAADASLLAELGNFPNLVVLQTFSKAWGLAGARVGLAFGAEKIIELLTRVKPPYNVSRLSQDAALAALAARSRVAEWVDETIRQREFLSSSLAGLKTVEAVYSSDANFLLTRFSGADEVYEFLLARGIVVRNRSRMPLCDGCLRITVGTDSENRRLIAALRDYGKLRGSVRTNTFI